MTYLDHIKSCNNLKTKDYIPFFVENFILGWLHIDRCRFLIDHHDLIDVRQECVSFPKTMPASAYESAIDTLIDRLIENGVLEKKRNELYHVSPRIGGSSLFCMDRSAISFFGIAACGVHLNGFVRKEGETYMWIGKRAMDRQIEPGKLDNIVAGGQPVGLSLRENLIKEAAEEAAMPKELAERAVSAGIVRYCLETGNGLRRDTLFCFDIDLTDGFIPHSSDGEMESFQLLPINDICRLILETKQFKFNVPLVIIDFLIRHGHITPDTEKDYPTLCAELRGPEHP